MKHPLVIIASALALGAAGVFSTALFSPLAAQSVSGEVAAVQTARFIVENMTCALCPVTVKTAMESVTGVQSVQIDFAAKTALVVFDPSVTTIEAIAAASTNAGYPAATRS